LERSFREDTTFFPSLIFQSVFSLENGDTLAAKEFYKKAASLNTGNKLITKLRSVWNAFDSLHSSPEKQTVIRLHSKIAASYRSMGVNEMAIDEFEKILKIEGGNIDALSALADLYEMKQRWYPAYQCTRRLLLADPNNITWKEKCAELEKRL
jgi:tetratricopeptide (TPR) repeat protein